VLADLVTSLMVRVGLAGLTAFAVSLAAGAWLIRFFHQKQVIEDTSQPDHAGLDDVQRRKKNVPTMGGLMIIGGVLVATLLWNDLGTDHTMLAVGVIAVLGVAGFIDDYIKLYHKPARGLNKTQKLLVQFVLGGIVGWFLVRAGAAAAPEGHPNAATLIFLPFAEEPRNLEMWYILWAAFVMAALSNAVNLTDGLDGLAGGSMVIATGAMILIAPMVFANISMRYFIQPPGQAQALVLAASVAGATAAFLWYNAHPAQIFMGDTGSLTLGGLLAYIALVAKLDVLIFVLGAVFVIDELTVALQIASFKVTKKRIFPITPIHHYFQVHLKWPEQKIVARFWIVGIVAALVSMALATCY
jgi:phospho-N-acetylmuramoyl-pentapeptide-transferase